MAIQSGSDLLLKIGDGGTPEIFTVIGGLYTTTIRVNNQPVVSTDVESGKWRKLLPNSGVQSITINADGVFSDSNSENMLRAYSFSNEIHNYELCFGNGDILIGAFQISHYNRIGNHNDAERFSITLQSSGSITYNIA